MYADFKAAWLTKCGTWPTAQNFVNAEKVFSPGKNNAMACAMQLREGGHTRKQQKVIMKAAYNDIDREIEAGFLKRPVKPLKAVVCPITGRKVKVYKCSFVKAKRAAVKATTTKATKATKATATATSKARVSKATT